MYVINDKLCKLTSVGCSTDSLKGRFPNHKSHIKSYYRSCEVSKHYIDNETIHKLDRSTCAKFDLCLKEQLEVFVVEHVDVSQVGPDTKSRMKKCKEREWFWQNQLKTMRDYGGMNVREEKPY